MRSYNQVTLIGNAGRDAEVREIKDGAKVATITVATSQKGFTRKNGSKVEPRTDWHTVTLWRQLAEYAGAYVKKGDLLHITGELRNRTYEDKNGVRRYVTEIMATSLMILSGARREEGVKENATREDVPQISEEQYRQQFEGSEEEKEGEIPF